MSVIELAEQIVCVEHEVERRDRVYARRVLFSEGPLEPEEAAAELAQMRAVLETLKAMQRYYAYGKGPAAKAIIETMLK